MQTLEVVMTKYEVEIPDYLKADADIQVVTGPARQGDVTIFPMRPGLVAGLEPIPAQGIPVIKGENGGNTHLLVGEGDVQFARGTSDPLVLGTLVVGRDTTAFMLHPEHGCVGIGEGTYRIGRQRQMADQIRVVSD